VNADEDDSSQWQGALDLEARREWEERQLAGNRAILAWIDSLRNRTEEGKNAHNDSYKPF
jgi:hypothetical protein